MTLGTGFEQLGFVGPIVSSAMVNAYALRGTLGVDYEFNDCNTVGFYYQSKMSFNFPRCRSRRVRRPTRTSTSPSRRRLGLGIANRSLMDGNLLLAADVYYKLWEDAALWQDVMVNQWALAVGAQLTRDNMKYRLGYSFNSNPINHSVGSSFDGIPGVGATPSSCIRPPAPLRQSAPHHRRRRTAGFPASGARSRPVCRRAAPRAATTSARQHGLAGDLLHRPGPHLAHDASKQAVEMQ